MRKALLALAVLAICLPLATGANAAPRAHQLPHSIGRVAAKMDVGTHPFALAGDCDIAVYNICSSWIWVLASQVEGSVFGSVFSPDQCSEGCASGGAVSNILLYSRCNVVPGTIDGIRITGVDANNCPTDLKCDSGPIDLVHCVSGDRWTNIPMPLCHVDGNPFAVEIVVGHGTGGVSDVQFALDNGVANLLCSLGVTGTFPGCFSTTPSCPGWTMGTEASYIYAADVNGDTVPDDLCALYGTPYGLAFPYLYPYGYITNNLIVGVSLDCSNPTATEPTSWGHVKALYQ